MSMSLESPSLFDAEDARGLLEQARLKLSPPKTKDSSLPVLAAAAFFAAAALGFAAAAVLAPPETVSHTARHGPH